MLATCHDAPDSELSSYIDGQANRLTPQHLLALCQRLPRLRSHFSSINNENLPDLADQFEFLCLVVEDDANCLGKAVCREATDQAAFALLSLENNIDRLSDSVHEADLLDAAAMVRTILQRHETAFCCCTRSYKLGWPLSPDGNDYEHVLVQRLRSRSPAARMGRTPWGAVSHLP